MASWLYSTVLPRCCHRRVLCPNAEYQSPDKRCDDFALSVFGGPITAVPIQGQFLVIRCSWIYSPSKDTSIPFGRRLRWDLHKMVLAKQVYGDVVPHTCEIPSDLQALKDVCDGQIAPE